MIQPVKKRVRPAAVRGLITAGVAVFVCVCVYMGWGALSKVDGLPDAAHVPAPEETVSAAGESVALTPLPLSGAGEYSISYQPVTDAPEAGLLSMLWQQREAEPAQMVYSSFFERGDQPYPVSVLDTPGAEADKLLLISTGADGQEYLHYRLVRFSGGELADLWTRDYVPGGRLGVQDGVVVEQRGVQTQTKDLLDGHQLGGAVSYIIPYALEEGGEILLPLDTLHVHVGDHVFLVGAASEALKASTQSGIALREKNEEALAFRADAAGEDVLLLQQENNDREQALYLKVSE